MEKVNFKQQIEQLKAAQNRVIKQLREKGLTTQQIADQVGISRQALDLRELRMRANARREGA